MKRSAPSKDKDVSPPPTKRKREQLPAYESQAQLTDESGNVVWPAPREEMENARRIIMECAEKKEMTIIVPDKDADGLSSAKILYLALTTLGLPADKIHPHVLSKGNTVHDAYERDFMAALKPSYIFVVDQGSRPAPPLVPDPNCISLIIDHHFATPTDFPAHSHHVNACHFPPVATACLLTYELVSPLSPSLAQDTAWLCALGTHGDLGNTLKWRPPFPDMTATFAQHSKKAITDAVSLINAPRRTAAFNVPDAWSALLAAASPAALLSSPALLAARDLVARETERCTHAAPRFSRDASVAILRIHSACQVHPIIATRWAGFLASKKLQYVLVANSGYTPGQINFSCRPARAARARGDNVNVIELLRAAARSHASGDLEARLGESFARGHVQASGGIVGVAKFEELMVAMGEGEGSRAKKDGASPSKGKGKLPAQKNTLGNYFGKKKEGVGG